MRSTTSDILGQTAYLRRSCDILLGQLQQIDRMVVGTEDLTPIQEAAIERANTNLAEFAKDHLELASQHVSKWHSAVHEALQMEPSWVRE